MALTEVVGRTGSGKSLWANAMIYDELTRIMNNGKDFPIYNLWHAGYSVYDWVVINFDFNDSRGNFTKFCKEGNECFCENVTRVKYVFLGKKGEEVLTEVEQTLFEVDVFSKKKIAVTDHWEYGGFCIGAEDFPEVYHIKNCMIMFDEAGTRFSNRDWDKMPPGYLLYLTAHRHNVTKVHVKQCDIFVFVQQLDLLDITLERLTSHIFLIRPLFGLPRNPIRLRWYNKIPGVYVQRYFQHEVLKKSPPPIVTVEGRVIPPNPYDDVESLMYHDWLWFPSFPFIRKWSQNKYVACYSTVDSVRELKRSKGV